MAYELFYQYLFKLDPELSFLRLFKYITFRSAYGAVTALLLSFLFGPALIRYLKSKKLGQPIRDDGPQTHLTKSGTPTMGGILILGLVVLSTFFWARLDNYYVLILLFATLAFGAIGFIDDYRKLILKNSKGLSGIKKLLAQFSISLLVVFFISQVIYQDMLSLLPLHIQDFLSNGGKLSLSTIQSYIGDYNSFPLYVPFLDTPVFDFDRYSFLITVWDFNLYMNPVYLLFGMLVIVGSSNAVNLTDGLDGLAIGLLIFAGIAFGILAYVTGNSTVSDYLKIEHVTYAGEVTVFCASFVGAGMGFLWYNAYPAQVFMGDTGSLALGALLGIIALMIKKELLLVIIGGIFVIEALSVIIQVLYYKWKKKRIFKMAPIHHHFELGGWHESKVMIRFWIIGALLALIGLSTLKIQ